MLSCKDISKSFGADSVLKNITFLLGEKEKAAIVGVNGAGKTTLFKILTGELAADGGSVAVAKGAELGYLAQIPDMETTVHDEMQKVFARVIELEKSLRGMERRMALETGDGLRVLMEDYERATHMFEQLRGYEYQSRIRGVLRGLGFADNEFSRPVHSLSGGEKTRLALAGLLLREPDILLLDEPTNHLDLVSVEWLEEFLALYAGSALIISHDRYFLDRLATKVIQIEHGCSSVYNGNYSLYAQKRETDRETGLKHYLSQQKEIKRQEAIIAKLRSYNREKSVKRAESREKLLSKVERLEKPMDTDKIHMSLQPERRSGTDVLTATALRKSFGGRRLFENVGFEIKRSDKVALIGANGVGKTTLLKILLSEIPSDGGGVALGQNVSIGYYEQGHESLDLSKTVFDEVSDSYPKLTVLELRNALAAFMFTGDDVYKPVSALSGGERARVALVKLMLGNCNFLVLDEPTNHLDIFSREILEDALSAYGGTVLYVSHDRYFISRTADRIIELTESGAAVYNGGYDYYLMKKIPAPAAASAAESKAREKEAPRKRGRRIESIEGDIEILETELSRLDGLLLGEAGADFQRANELYEERLGVQARLSALYDEWENWETHD